MGMLFRRSTWSLGAAIFAMFFGAGNVVFPLALGLRAGEQIPYALCGLLVTAIGGPLLGLLTALLYEGRCWAFFSGWGKFLGVGLLGMSLALLGPFCVLPRCCVVAHAALQPFWPELSLQLFALLFGALALLVALRPTRMLALLGMLLSPLLLVCLLAIIAVALSQGGEAPASDWSRGTAFLQGLEQGYDTMDLIAAIIFASSIWGLVARQSQESVAHQASVAGLLGGAMLCVIYAGLAWAVALHAPALRGTPPEALLGQLALSMLGPQLAILANIAVVLACFTTVVSLLSAISGIIETELLAMPIGRPLLLSGMCVIMVSFATLGFATIQALLHPLLFVGYPLVIALTLHMLWRKVFVNKKLGISYA